MLVESRFDVVRVLGSGGMAHVYEVFDHGSQRRLALKRLQETADEQRKRRLLELFEREFYTLSQLSHPSIVQAFDYGVDSQGSYYTMELLEGGVLQNLAPLPYKQACSLARELCSALSLLHSRRLVYRDLNPRNVHCDAQGRPKLIDFGAIASMGQCTQVVGTPAYCAPEALDMQPLDARTDLFSLGATLYFALTGQHAFPAKTFAQLRQLWDWTPARPSAHVPDLPASVDSLVMDLLKLDPAARPGNAGELMEQLAAISGKTLNEHAGVMQAYLSTPSMIGRDAQLALLRAKLTRASHGEGTALSITSASGAGRTRFLAACQLEAKISGALVAHASAADFTSEYGVVRSLGQSLVDIAPDLARRAADFAGNRELLERIVPSLGGNAELRTASELPRSEALTAIRAWLITIARERTLVLSIDDLHRSDEPSAACLSRLAHNSQGHAMLLIASYETEASAVAPAALKLYQSSASHLPLETLSETETAELLRSMFGNVPHVQALAHKLFAIAAGNPRDTMLLAQTLVDRGAVKYRAGAWSLATSFDGDWLPQSMQQAVIRELSALDPIARNLACALSLADDRALDFEECTRASGTSNARSAHEALQQLLRLQLARPEVDRYTLAHRGLHAALRGAAQAGELQSAHTRLAEIFARRGNEAFREAKHLLLAGDMVRGVETLVDFAVTSQTRTDNDPREYVQLVLSMPEDWLDVFDNGIAASKALARPRIDTFRLRNRLASLLNVLGGVSHVHLLALIRQLCRDSGLDAYAKLDPALDKAERLTRALAEAKQTYETSAEHERGLEPGLALRYLVRALLLAAGMVALGLDYALWQALPSIAPLDPLSPAFGLIERLVGAVAARVAGIHERARHEYGQILERLDQPDRAGLDASNHRFLRLGVMYGAALLEAGLGLQSSLERANALETEALHSVNALQVRMIHALWQGRVGEADQLREAAELRRIESGARQMADGSHLVWQTLAHAYSDDLMRLKQVIEELRTLARRHAGWTPVVDYAQGEFQRLRGDHTQALEHLSLALRQVTAGTHQIWPHAAAAQIRVLCALDRLGDAVQYGELQLQAAERAQLGYSTNYVRMPLAIACARHGEHSRALELAGEALRGFQALGTTGLHLVLAYETCSRVAWHAGKLDDYKLFAERCALACRDVTGQALRARADGLLNAASAGAVAPDEISPEPFATSMLATSLQSAFRACDEPEQRAERTLRLLLSHSGAQSGVLYLVRETGPVLAAHIGLEPTPELAASVRELIETEVRQRGLVTASLDAELEATVFDSHALVLLCHQTSDGAAVTGAAALMSATTSRFVQPGALAARLSRMLADAGDVIPLGSDS